MNGLHRLLPLFALLLALAGAPATPAHAAPPYGPASPVGEINPGGLQPGSDPANMVAVGDTLFFSAANEDYGVELWRSDGSDAGTRLVADIYPGPGSSWPEAPAALGETLLFFATDPDRGLQLWRSDGTPAGTFPLRPAHVAPRLSATLDGVAYLVDFPPDGLAPELWRTDGTLTGTYRIDERAAFWVAADADSLYFADAAGLWHGATPASASLIAPLADSSFNTWAVAGPYLFLTIYRNGQGELWRSDGTAAGTILLHSFPMGGSLGGDYGPDYLTAAGERLFFFAYDPTSGKELWVSDGTPAGTTLVRDIAPGAATSVCGYCYGPGELLAAGDQVYFIANDQADHSSELWRSDGTEAGTVELRPAVSRLLGIQGDGALLLFGGDEGSIMRSAPPFAAATALASDLSVFSHDDTSPTMRFAQTGDTIYLIAGEPQRAQLWRSDGTPAGTRAITTVNPARGAGSNPGELTAFAGQLLFVADDGAHGREIWTSRPGRPAELLADLAPGPGTPFEGNHEQPRDAELTPIADRVFFTTYAGIYETRGTAGSTGPARWGCTGCVSLGGAIFYPDYDPEHGFELWRRDGLSGAPRLVADLSPGPESSFPQGLRALAGAVYFAAGDGAHGNGLWRVGPSGPPRLLWSDPERAPGPAVELAGGVYFLASNPYSDGAPPQLWRVTGATAELVDPALPVPEYPHAIPLTAAGGRLFLALADAAHGAELWASDGAPGGWRLARDIYAGRGGAMIGQARAVGGELLFRAVDREHGAELWASDGTAAGTRRLTDIAPGVASAWPAELTAVGDTLYFRADDGASGPELWALPLEGGDPPGPATPLLDRFDRRDGPLGRPWVGPGRPGYRIADRALDVGAGGPLYWQPRLGDAQEVYATLAAIDPAGRHGLLLKVESRDDVVDWRYGAIRVSYAPAAGQVQVETYQPQVGWQTAGSFAASLAAGDRFGARAGADGLVTVYQNGRLLGTADTSATNGGFFAAGERGRVGLWFAGAAAAAVDDVGGGDLP